MATRIITPERREQRKKLLELLLGAGINDVAGVQEQGNDDVLKNGLEGELDKELCYSKYEPEQGNGQQPQRVQQGNERTGGRYIPSWRSSSPAGYLISRKQPPHQG